MDYWMLALAVAGVFIQNLFKKNYIAAQGAELIPSLLFNELTALAALGFLAAALQKFRRYLNQEPKREPEASNE